MAQGEEIEPHFSVKEVAKALDLKPGKVWAMIYARDIESVIVPKRNRRVPLSAINSMLEKGRVPAAEKH